MYNRFPLTRGYPPGALTRRTRYAVPAGELHVRELCYVLPSAKPVQRFIIGISVLCPPLRALAVRDKQQAAAATGQPYPHGV